MKFSSAWNTENDEKVNLMVALSQRIEFSASSMLMQHYSVRARHIYFSRLVDDFLYNRNFHATYRTHSSAPDFDTFVKQNMHEPKYLFGL